MQLFSEILRGVGCIRLDGTNAVSGVPKFIRITEVVSITSGSSIN